MKLHLGCGEDYRQGYTNIDLYTKGKVDERVDIRHLPYAAKSIDEILSLHVIEHFDFKEAQLILQDWYNLLKDGGKIILETPDLLNMCKAFYLGNEQDRINLYGHFFSTPWEPGQIHKFLYTETQLAWTLEQRGFKKINRIKPLSIDRHYEDSLYLALEAWK